MINRKRKKNKIKLKCNKNILISSHIHFFGTGVILTLVPIMRKRKDRVRDDGEQKETTKEECALMITNN